MNRDVGLHLNWMQKARIWLILIFIFKISPEDVKNIQVGAFSYVMVLLCPDLSVHTVLVGAIGAEWLKAFKGYIENPESMLL